MEIEKLKQMFENEVDSQKVIDNINLDNLTTFEFLKLLDIIEDFDKNEVYNEVVSRLFTFKNEDLLKAFLERKKDVLMKKDEDVDLESLLGKSKLYNYKLPESFMIEHQDELNWGRISSKQNLSRKFIVEHKELIDFNRLSFNNYIKLEDEDIDSLKDNIDWDFISLRDDLKISFIREYKDRLNWDYVSSNIFFNEKELKEFSDYINWEKAMLVQNISEDVWKEEELDEVAQSVRDRQLKEMTQKFGIKDIDDPVFTDFLKKYYNSEDDSEAQLKHYLPWIKAIYNVSKENDWDTSKVEVFKKYIRKDKIDKILDSGKSLEDYIEEIGNDISKPDEGPKKEDE